MTVTVTPPSVSHRDTVMVRNDRRQEMSNLTLTTLYLDKDVVKKCEEKLIKHMGETTKGSTAALVRTLLLIFAEEPNTSPIVYDMVKECYTYSTLKNKRSKL